LLKIKPVRRYRIARYPQGTYRPHSDLISDALYKGALAPAAMLLIMETSCGSGTTGPPPLPVDLVTENEARAVFDQVFADNNITLENNVSLWFKTAANDSIQLDVDGYNDSVNVGYEYMAGEDYRLYTPEVRAALDSAIHDAGPYINVVQPIEKGDNYETVLENIMQGFIDSLKAQGVI
jgi:hypothetical protein